MIAFYETGNCTVVDHVWARSVTACFDERMRCDWCDGTGNWTWIMSGCDQWLFVLIRGYGVTGLMRLITAWS